MNPVEILKSVMDWWPLIGAIGGGIVYAVRMEGQVKAAATLARSVEEHTSTRLDRIDHKLDKMDDRQEELIDYLLRKENWNAQRERRSPAPTDMADSSGLKGSI